MEEEGEWRYYILLGQTFNALHLPDRTGRTHRLAYFAAGKEECVRVCVCVSERERKRSVSHSIERPHLMTSLITLWLEEVMLDRESLFPRMSTKLASSRKTLLSP